MHRVVFDTNSWISGLLGKKFRRRLWHLAKDGNNVVLVSEELFNEIRTAVAKKTHLHSRITLPDIEVLVQQLQQIGEIVDVHSAVSVCRDPKDNYLLAMSQDGGADYLITGDDDLLALKTFGKTKIMKLAEFENE
jgi:putative PIN family toxin of toxin-antitoxin system